LSLFRLSLSRSRISVLTISYLKLVLSKLVLALLKKYPSVEDLFTKIRNISQQKQIPKKRRIISTREMNSFLTLYLVSRDWYTWWNPPSDESTSFFIRMKEIKKFKRMKAQKIKRIFLPSYLFYDPELSTSSCLILFYFFIMRLNNFFIYQLKGWIFY